MQNKSHVSKDDKGNFMETYMGKKFYPLSPDSEIINLADIAHPLSMMVRFNGHCKTFYTVGQHSINVAREIARHGFDPIYQMYGLLHDGSEAYLADINRPAKSDLPEYVKLESIVQAAIWEAFGLKDPSEQIWGVVKYFDDTVLFNEAQHLMPCRHWCQHDFERLPQIDLSVRNPSDVEKEFVELFFELRDYLVSQVENED
ncbi:hypothetical protein QB910_000094 [Dabrowskivirus KKP3916]|uniref:Phosphohydrolase n=1 Tax=Alicyclobacillus phage KKP_3916 TaxID=3040651 RepID=A0AAT9V7T0_9CAUD|nr:hypothetical protein QB910_000094 [Alicyclobacillus phage KKP 3916]